MDTINLVDAMYVCSLYPDQYRIGILKNDSIFAYNKGDIVLFEVYKDNPGKCTMHKPMRKSEITKNRSNHNFIHTICTIVGVPVGCITEVII